MNIALVHDYLREYGGAERVVETLHEMWPEAPLYTSFVDWEALGDHAERFRGWDIRTSWVQKNPFVKKFHSPLRFLARRIWESFDLSGYDVVISSSGWFISRGVITKSNNKNLISNKHSKNQKDMNTHTAVHFCYIHHPPRNLYGYPTGSTLQKYKLVRMYASVINFFMRHYDFETAQKVDFFIANSLETKRRVAKFYRRDADVIYPPIEILNIKYQISNKRSKNQKDANGKSYFLSVGRLAWAKRIDVIIRACNELKLPLKIVGTGKEEEYLKSIAGPTVEFLGGVSDRELSDLYANAKALIFCALDEDFGMVPVEAMAHGTPVIGLAQGGVKETVIDPSDGSGQAATGILFDAPEVEDLTKAIRRFRSLDRDWAKDCRNRAQMFGKERFKKEIMAFIRKHRSPER